MEYQIRKALAADIPAITAIYNSNPDFLLYHLGVTEIDASFILDDQQEMSQHGFESHIIIDEEDRCVGVLDHRPDDTVYLSLFMLESGLRGQGLGTQIYRQFERALQSQDRKSIRIDVVTDHDPHVSDFWEDLGFQTTGTTTLHWGNKSSSAAIMIKKIKETGQSKTDL